MINQILTIAFSGFWNFVGMTILLGIPVNAIVSIMTALFKMFSVWGRGWPTKDEMPADNLFKTK